MVMAMAKTPERPDIELIAPTPMENTADEINDLKVTGPTWTAEQEAAILRK